MTESVQKKMTERIKRVRNVPCEDKLKYLNLHSLEKRKLRGGFIEVCEWIRGIKKGHFNKVLVVKEPGRAHIHIFKLNSDSSKT